jgi:hypothetical protein
MMVKIIVLVCFIIVLAPGAVFAQIVELEGRFWFADLKGSTRIEGSGIEGTNIDFDRDLKLDADPVPEVRLTFSTGFASKIRLAYLHADFDGSTTLGRTIEFSGTTFTANTRVTSEIELHYARVGWAWQFIALPGLFKVGPMLEAKGFLIDASIEAQGAGPRESARLPIAFPTIGVMANVTPHRTVDLFAEVSGVPLGDFGHVVDAEAGIRYIPFHFFSVSAGYRVFDVRIGDSDDFGKLRLFGPFVGASLRF